MNLVMSTHQKKKSQTASHEVEKKQAFYVHLTHKAEMALLKQQADIINSSPESALAFLKQAGLLTATGRVRRLIRD